ncbi:hypothetical protein SUGI_0774260 [Cryptomeria japonica]|uniref:uncharacterized protein LOC131039810 isoform X2 n=1 Tax=Cryptomeria japonica TaxID=3369 RepID=UPI002414A292|nr:uncharacterized protein LOC131039810 isoform X2 [Cryptomeria japonica]GLJ38030.1 hypothetical protein SUGI_0774260 [Cryptomeria japonica]
MNNVIPPGSLSAMENKDVGEILVPCTTCTKNCFKIHGKTEEKESFDGRSYFFKVMLGDFAQKLRVPPAFVPKLLNEVGIGRNVLMQGPSGQKWDVKLCYISTEMYFAHGWEKFVHHNKIQFGDFLVIKYVCKSYFKVRIFGRSGCQKIDTDFGPDTHHECNQPMDSKLSLDLVPASQGKALAKRIRGHPPKENQTETVKRRYRKNYYVSNRRPVTEEERSKALQAAQSFRSNKPFCLIILKPSYVYNAIWLRFPNACRDRLELPREKIKVVLVDPNNKEWDVQYLGNVNQPGLCGGWKYFSFDNNLEEGDVCIFEQEDKLKFRVHIFRVAEICTPYKWIKGRQMNDSVPLLTNYSNEKIKDEDLAINLSAKMFRRRLGLDAKEVNTVLREDLAENFSAKAFEPEQGIDIKEIKTVSREDLTANLSARSFGLEQGRHAKEVNTVSREDLSANFTANLSARAFGPEQGRDAKEVNTVSWEDLSANFTANLSARAFGPEQEGDAKEVNTVSREDLSAKFSARAFGPEQGKDAKVNTVSREYLSANFSARAYGPEQRKDEKQVNSVSRKDLAINMMARAYGPEQRKDEKQVNSVSRKDLAINMMARVFGPEQEMKQIQDAKQVNGVSREDIATNLLVKAFGPEQNKNAEQVNSVSREGLSVNMLANALGAEQGLKEVQHMKQVNTVSREDLARDFSAKSFGPEQRKDAKQLNSVSREDLAIKMLSQEFGSEQQIKQVQDDKQVYTFSREDLSTNLSAKVFIPEQRKDAKHVNSVLREDPAFNMLARVFKPEQKIKQEKKNNMKTGRNRRAKCTLGIRERKEGCRRSLRLVERNNLIEHPKKEQLCPASSVDGKKSIVKDTMLLSKKTSSLDPVKGYGEEDLMIIWDSNAATHGMPSNENLILSGVHP